jgi:hypothetical protein
MLKSKAKRRYGVGDIVLALKAVKRSEIKHKYSRYCIFIDEQRRNNRVKKKAKIRITERDFELLKLLGECCAATIDSVGKLYGTRSYHETRITALDREGYVRRKNNLVYLGEAGKRYLAERGIQYRSLPTSARVKERNPKIARVHLDFASSSWRFVSSWDVKGSVQANKADRLLGVLEGRSKYAVYDIGKRPQEKSLYNLKREMEKLPATYRVNRALIFYESDRAKEVYGEERLGLKEQLLLPYDETSIALMRAYGEEDLIKKAAQLTFEHGGPAKWSSADFTVDNGKQAIVLVLNDIEKKAKLRQYYEMTQYRLTDRQSIAIICLEGQEKEYAEQFPGCEIRTVKAEELISRNAEAGNNGPVSIEAEL